MENGQAAPKQTSIRTSKTLVRMGIYSTAGRRAQSAAAPQGVGDGQQQGNRDVVDAPGGDAGHGHEAHGKEAGAQDGLHEHGGGEQAAAAEAQGRGSPARGQPGAGPA